MQEFTTIASLRGALAAERRRRAGTDAQVGFVPTMGNLHEGHLRLIEACRHSCELTVASVYVNPLQFGPGEDLESYPRTLAEDRRKLEQAGTDFLFAPPDAELYPHGRERQTRVVVPGLTDILCGRFRPGHFDGVATVVLKLFNILQPDYAFFGEKDYQQLIVLKTMVAHLDVPVTIVGVQTERAASGLALSSRNQYLTPTESNVAPMLQRTLRDVAEQLAQGARDFDRLQNDAIGHLVATGFAPDYFEIRNPADLAAPQSTDCDFVILAAARLGRARLIDNVRVPPESLS
jgi:pantoate--beta-alanine ligase